jgi:hypothetical protein
MTVKQCFPGLRAFRKHGWETLFPYFKMAYTFALQIFTGNSDLETVVLNSLESAVETRYVRFRPKEWHNGIAMRVEVLGLNPFPGKKK